jgi:DNA-binding beta-propeller fold protein YncE
MRRLPPAASVCAAILLSACGGGGGGGSSPSALPPTGASSAGSSTGSNTGSGTSVACNYVIYVTNTGNNTVTEYDPNGNQIALSKGEFPNLSQPLGITLDSVNNHLFVVTSGGSVTSPSGTPEFSDIAEYDESGNPVNISGEFLTDFPIWTVTFDPVNSGLLAVSNNNGSVQIYNQSGNEIGGFPTVSVPFSGQDAQQIVFDTSNQQWYLVEANTGSITEPYNILVYDKNGNVVTPSGTFPNLANPSGIAYDSSNNHLYVVNDTSNVGQSTITEYDGNGNQIPTSGTFPNLNYPNGIAFDPQNQQLYVTNGNSTITVYDQNGNQIKTSGSFPNVNQATPPLNPTGYLTVAPQQ